jgi:hypothetical protein
MWDDSIDAVRDRRVDRAASLVAGAELEVIDEQLAAAVEQLRQRARTGVGLEAVILLDSDPGHLAPLTRQLVAEPGVLLLAGEQLVAGNLPLLPCSDLVIGHRSSPSCRYAVVLVAARPRP